MGGSWAVFHLGQRSLDPATRAHTAGSHREAGGGWQKSSHICQLGLLDSQAANNGDPRGLGVRGVVCVIRRGREAEVRSHGCS